MSKKIALVGWRVGENSFGATLPYLEFLSNFGIVEILTPHNTKYSGYDLLVIPGGSDVDPRNYNARPSYYAGHPDVFKEAFDKYQLPHFIDNKTPIFGICRGMQSLISHFGGRLGQHIYQEFSRERTDLAHEIALYEPTKVPDFIKRNFYKKDGRTVKEYKVNSMHHQGAYPKALADTPIQVLAVNKGVGNAELIKHVDLPIYAVQWHPEEIYDSISQEIILNLLQDGRV